MSIQKRVLQLIAVFPPFWCRLPKGIALCDPAAPQLQLMDRLPDVFLENSPLQSIPSCLTTGSFFFSNFVGNNKAPWCPKLTFDSSIFQEIPDNHPESFFLATFRYTFIFFLTNSTFHFKTLSRVPISQAVFLRATSRAPIFSIIFRGLQTPAGQF